MLWAGKELAAGVMLGLLLAGGGCGTGYAATDAAPAAGAEAAGAWAQTAKRLILTDGSYQAATEWQRTGERVKYYSAERGEWEEIPAELVDWKATEAWNAGRSASQAEELKQVTEEEIAARKEAQLSTPLVAPGLRLPAAGGVFLLEEAAGKAALHKLDGSKVRVDEEVGKNAVRRTLNPAAGVEQKLELTGGAAKVRVRAGTPSIFVDLDNEEGTIAGDQFRIVRLERKKDIRVVGKNKASGRGDASVTWEFRGARAEKFSGDWWRLTVLEELPPGEYAIVCTAEGQGGVVWDFGVEK
jgi:hypothetical protein